MSADAIYRVVRRVGQRANIRGVRCSPHTFRHTFAKNYLLNGGDVFSLQKILGPSSLEVVRLYVNLATADVHSQHRKHSPVDIMRLRSWCSLKTVNRAETSLLDQQVLGVQVNVGPHHFQPAVS